jgi:hypothetical protein
MGFESGIYGDEKEPYLKDFEPYIIFNKDGTFEILINHFDGLSGGAGTYTIKGTLVKLAFTSFEIPVSDDFDMNNCSFNIDDKHQITYTGDSLGMTVNGDVFSWVG